jgi:hypothetical protein
MKCAQSNSHVRTLLATLDQDCFGAVFEIYATTTVKACALILLKCNTAGDKGGFDEAVSVDAQMQQNTSNATHPRNDASDSAGSKGVADTASTVVKSNVSWFEYAVKNVDPTVLLGVISVLSGAAMLLLSEWLLEEDSGFEPEF